MRLLLFFHGTWFLCNFLQRILTSAALYLLEYRRNRWTAFSLCKPQLPRDIMSCGEFLQYFFFFLQFCPSCPGYLWPFGLIFFFFYNLLLRKWLVCPLPTTMTFLSFNTQLISMRSAGQLLLTVPEAGLEIERKGISLYSSEKACGWRMTSVSFC